MGTSPAVLTETVWALAHQAKPVLPHEVVVLTTKTGKIRLATEILSGTPSVWEKLKAALRKEKIGIDDRLVFGETSIRVIPDRDGNEADDLRTGEDNLRTADFMLQQIRQYSEASDTVILASIAGGRKTMSALLFSCMTLLGRDEDKVYHVLIPPEYECGMDPPFYFPQKGATHQLLARGQPTEKKVSSAKIGIELFEVPFVRMRGWYQEKFKKVPPTYRALISRMQTMAPSATVYPEIEIDAWNGGVVVNAKPVSLSPANFAVLVLLAGKDGAKDLHKRLVAIHNSKGDSACDWLASFREGPRFQRETDAEDLARVMNELRNRLIDAGFANVETLVPKRGKPVMFPRERIVWHNREKMADICGCLFSSLGE